jgi:hypothetical protein
MGSDPRFANAALATCAVTAGTSGHGLGCIDMTTPSRDRERQQEKPAAHPSMNTATHTIQHPPATGPPN